MPPAVSVRNLGKRFSRYHADHPTTLKETLMSGLRRMTPVEHFWALRDVSFAVSPGRMLGVVGQNGAGKSTLLRLIGGIGRADEGQITVMGRVGALLDLGAGFHPDLTGRENVFINGVIAGLTRSAVVRRFDAIVAFAELEQFIDNPLRTYSTGMQMRLGFAIAAHTDPEVLLIDEILAVGDIAFQRKCLERIARFRANGCTIILVSHDVSTVRRLCDEALWLRQGKLMAHGPADIVAEQYAAEMSVETRRRTPETQRVVLASNGTELRINENRFGSLEVQIVGVHLLDPSGQHVSELDSGRSLYVEIEYLAPDPVPAPIFGVSINREDGLVCCDTSTDSAGLSLPTLHGRGHISVHFERLDLAGQQYYVDVGIYEKDWAYAYDYHWRAYPLLIRHTGGGKGILYPSHHWQMRDPSAPAQAADSGNQLLKVGQA